MNLPPCDHRQGEPGKLTCTHKRVRGRAPDKLCANCPWIDEPSEKMPLREVRPSKPPKPKGPCSHRSQESIRDQDCPSCCGRVRIKVYTCTEHGECTLGSIEGVKQCPCPDYQEKL